MWWLTARRLLWRTMIVSDLLLDWLAEDGYSLSETGWIRAQDRKFYFEVTAEQDGHRHIARARDREQAVVNLGMLIGYPLDE